MLFQVLLRDLLWISIRSGKLVVKSGRQCLLRWVICFCFTEQKLFEVLICVLILILFCDLCISGQGSVHCYSWEEEGRVWEDDSCLQPWLGIWSILFFSINFCNCNFLTFWFYLIIFVIDWINFGVLVWGEKSFGGRRIWQVKVRSQWWGWRWWCKIHLFAMCFFFFVMLIVVLIFEFFCSVYVIQDEDDE
jgi:hypothetical protein